MSDFSITKMYEAGSIGAMRAERIVKAILSDIKGEPVALSALRAFKSYIIYNDANGWLDVTICAGNKVGKLYTIMRRDEKRKKCMVCDVHICSDGRHIVRTHTWDI